MSDLKAQNRILGPQLAIHIIHSVARRRLSVSFQTPLELIKSISEEVVGMGEQVDSIILECSYPEAIRSEQERDGTIEGFA